MALDLGTDDGTKVIGGPTGVTMGATGANVPPIIGIGAMKGAAELMAVTAAVGVAVTGAPVTSLGCARENARVIAMARK